MTNNMTFTDDEKALIEKCFIVADSKWHKAFDMTISGDNLGLILKAMKASHDNWSVIQTKQDHDTMHAFYERCGLCKDGVVTIEEAKEKLREAKEREVQLRVDAMRATQEKQKHILETLQKQMRETDKTRDEIEAEIRDEHLQRQLALRAEMSALRATKLQKMEDDKMSLLEGLGIELDKIKPPVEKEPESPVPKPVDPEVKKMDILVEKKRAVASKKMEAARKQLEDYKKDELELLAKDMGIDVPSKVTKAEIIDLMIEKGQDA